MSQLPKGWVSGNLGQIASFEMGQAPPASASNFAGIGTIFVKAGEFGREVPVIKEWTTKPLKFARSSDVLICVVGATAGKLNLGIDCAIGRSVAAIRPLIGVNQRLLYRQLTLHVARLRADSTGSAQGVISKEMLSALPVELPPEPEQRRIADKLDTVLARVDAVNDRLTRAALLLKRFRQSVLAAAMSGRLNEDFVSTASVHPVEDASSGLGKRRLRRGVNEYVDHLSHVLQNWDAPASWVRASVAKLLACGAIEDLKDGNHGTNHPISAEFGAEGLPFITAAQVLNGHIDYECAPRLQGAALAKLRVGFAKVGDVVLTHKGTVGRVAIAEQACVLSPQTTYYRCDGSLLLPEYLRIYMESYPFQEQLRQAKSQTTRDFIPITQQYGLGVLLPPLRDQRAIVKKVQILFAYAERLEARLQAAQAAAERLTPSLLAKAFRGELVPQDPNDEPASELLKRLAASRAEQPIKARGRRKAGASA